MPDKDEVQEEKKPSGINQCKDCTSTWYVNQAHNDVCPACESKNVIKNVDPPSAT